MIKERNLTIDIAKGIGILLVVVGHFSSRQALPEWFIAFKDFIYLFHMPLFMACSGFLYASSLDECSYFNFLRKKFIRLMVPYFFISLCFLLIKLIAGLFVSLQFPVDFDSVLYYVFIHPSGGFTTFLWFLYTLFLIFLVYPLMSKLPYSKAIISCFAVILFYVRLPSVFCLDLFSEYFVFFYIGSCVREIFYKTKIQIKKLIVSLILSCSLLVLIGGFIITRNSFYQENIFFNQSLSFLCRMSGVVMVWTFSMLLEKNNGRLVRIALRLGKYSFAIYLLHTFTMGPFRIIGEKLFTLSQPFPFLLVLVVCVCAGIIVPVIIYRIISSKYSVLAFLIFGEKLQKMTKGINS